jgi:putative membrane protein
VHRRYALLIALIGVSSAAAAHGTAEQSSHAIEWLPAFLTGTVSLLFAIGYFALSSGQRAAIAPPWRLVSFLGAVLILVIALYSPIDELADHSFAWHMAQHILLMFGAGPLLALANTHLVTLCALPMEQRRTVGQSINRLPGIRAGSASRFAPALAALLFGLGLWLWHSPALYDAAIERPWVHVLEHMTFVVTSAVFWRMVWSAGDRRLDLGSALLLTAIVGLQGNLLAILILFAPSAIYSPYAANPLSDQQMAAMVMLIPASLVYLASAVRALRQLLGSAHRKAAGNYPT